MPPLTRTELLGLFSPVPHRFQMGLRRGNAATWLDPQAPDAATTAILAERRHWLQQHPQRHALFSNAAAPLVTATAAWVNSVAPHSFDASLGSLGTQWTPDFLLLHQDQHGEFCFVGGSICFPSSWAPEEKLGLPLTSIHSVVPGLNAEMGARIRTFLDRLPPNEVFERDNWSLSATSERNLHPALNRPRLGPATPLSGIFLRVERQAFVRLPNIAGLLFLIQIELHGLSELIADLELRNAFKAHFASMSDSVATYKGLAAVRLSLLREL